MTATPTSITLFEWETKGPADDGLAGRHFGDSSPAVRRVIERLRDGKLLGLTELRHGLVVEAFSHVGRVQVGDLDITIHPKIKGAALLSLLRYAYGFCRSNLISASTQLVDQCGIEDLLIHQLNAEAEELISRGLSRAYVSKNERLSSPRGRPDLTRIALDGGAITATLPCRHFVRVDDNLLNQVLMAGLRLASLMARAIDPRRESRRLASLLEERVSTIRLNSLSLDRAARQMNRLTAAYAPALSIIRLLVESQGVVLEGWSAPTTLSGFLFDMNAFFQALISRFLRENLPGWSVQDERGLKGMMRYNPEFNPRRRQSPTPRPDFVVTRQRRICSILDAKYRDLWERPLPREMLYQLVVYAISRRQRPQSAILYPTNDLGAKEARIDVTDPVFGGSLGQVCLRPVPLPLLEQMVAANSPQARGDRMAYAERLAFGE